MKQEIVLIWTQSFDLFQKAKQLFPADSKDRIKARVRMSHCRHVAELTDKSCYCYHHLPWLGLLLRVWEYLWTRERPLTSQKDRKAHYLESPMLSQGRVHFFRNPRRMSLLSLLVPWHSDADNWAVGPCLKRADPKAQEETLGPVKYYAICFLYLFSAKKAEVHIQNVPQRGKRHLKCYINKCKFLSKMGSHGTSSLEDTFKEYCSFKKIVYSWKTDQDWKQWGPED